MRKDLLKNKQERVGEKYITIEGYEIEIIKYINKNKVDVRFIDGTIVKNKTYSNIKKGNIKNPNHKSIYNTCYLGIGEFKCKVGNKPTIEYKYWKSMSDRCYGETTHKTRPQYADCVMIDEWKCFQNFATWCKNNYTEGFQLDKDILVKGNKIYSPETCCFVPSEINNLFIKRNALRGEYPIGVTKRGKKFRSHLNISGGYLGTFDTPEEAFQAYKTAKEEYIKEVANKWREQISEKVYQVMLNYKVEITD